MAPPGPGPGGQESTQGRAQDEPGIMVDGTLWGFPEMGIPNNAWFIVESY